MGTEKKIKQELRELLIEKKRQLLADVKRAMGDKLDEDVRLSFEIAQDNPDKSVRELIKHVDAAIIGNKSEEIDKIDAALTKLKEGTYGLCDECGCDIPVERMRIVPFATHCVLCQHEIDRLKKQEAYQEESPNLPEGTGDRLPEEEK